MLTGGGGCLEVPSPRELVEVNVGKCLMQLAAPSIEYSQLIYLLKLCELCRLLLCIPYPDISFQSQLSVCSMFQCRALRDSFLETQLSRLHLYTSTVLNRDILLASFRRRIISYYVLNDGETWDRELHMKFGWVYRV